MRNCAIGVTLGLAIVTLVSALGCGSAVSSQDQSASLPRTKDGKPDLSGIWQAMNTANWDIQDHSARQGAVTALGAAFSIPSGQGVVEGNEIPYKPEALAKKQENAADWLKQDPEIKCFMPGVPRAMYMPYPFQIIQSDTDIHMAFEFASAARTIFMGEAVEAPVGSWMGWSRGKWDGDTLVVTATDFNGLAWFDRAGNYQSDTLRVVERYTPISRDALMYEATIEDATLYTRPWKMSMPLYRRLEKNVQLLDYKCVEFAEEAMYGHLKKPTTE